MADLHRTVRAPAATAPAQVDPRRILSSLYVAPATKTELARDLDLAPKGGSWNAAWKALRSNGLIEERDGGRWAVTLVISALKPERR